MREFGRSPLVAVENPPLLEASGAGVRSRATVARSHGPDVRGLIDKQWKFRKNGQNSDEIRKICREVKCLCVRVRVYVCVELYVEDCHKPAMK